MAVAVVTGARPDLGDNHKVTMEMMPIEPPEIPPATPGNPTEPPPESPPGSPRPEVPPPIQEPGEPPQPEELPGKMPDELPVRGPNGPRTPSPVTDTGTADLTGPEPDVDVNAGQLEIPRDNVN
jgi:hypothetical protein